MTHSVRRHLRIGIEEYDTSIRAWIPGYEAMLRHAADAVASVSPSRVLELGAGTGGLSAAILLRPGVGAVELVDVDPEMLDRARVRLADFGDRARFTVGSFEDPLPACDAAAASLALHHLPRRELRERVMRRVWEALAPGGVFVNADVMMPADGPGREAAFEAWAAWMARSGIGRERAYAHFDEWSAEDTYLPVEDELAAMAAAGFEARCVWRDEPTTVLVGRRPAGGGS